MMRWSRPRSPASHDLVRGAEAFRDQNYDEARRLLTRAAQDKQYAALAGALVTRTNGVLAAVAQTRANPAATQTATNAFQGIRDTAEQLAKAGWPSIALPLDEGADRLGVQVAGLAVPASKLDRADIAKRAATSRRTFLLARQAVALKRLVAAAKYIKEGLEAEPAQPDLKAMQPRVQADLDEAESLCQTAKKVRRFENGAIHALSAIDDGLKLCADHADLRELRKELSAAFEERTSPQVTPAFLALAKVSTPPQVLEDGRRLYTKRCTECHDLEMLDVTHPPRLGTDGFRHVTASQSVAGGKIAHHRLHRGGTDRSSGRRGDSRAQGRRDARSNVRNSSASRCNIRKWNAGSNSLRNGTRRRSLRSHCSGRRSVWHRDTLGQALLLLGLAVLLIIAPPRRSPGVVWWLLAFAILAIALAAFLPSRWFALPEWRRVLTADFRVVLPATLSPQPWISVHAVCLLFAGLVFTLYLATHTWEPQSRRRAARWYVCGITLLAVVMLLALAQGWQVPFWPKVLNSMIGFGVFPNRNQTANVLALAGILGAALAFHAFERRRKGAWFWTVAMLILAIAIVKTSSRAGILLFFGGIASWVLLSSALSGTRKSVSLTVAGFALLLTGFFVFGGGSFERFQKLAQDSPSDYRVGIQKDALHLTAVAPWLGQGMGNFAPVFAMAREVSADQNRAIHPESDWLWVAVEMGWPAVVLLVAAVGLWLRQCLPLSAGSDRMLRSAAMICGVAFALHSFADVSGHRPGSAWPALFLAALAMHPHRAMENRRWVAPVFRGLGLILALIAAWWFASVFSERIDHAAPTPATVARLADRVEQLNFQREHGAAVVSANEALHINALNADLYFQRGLARVGEAFSVWGAAWDFGTARFLEPHWSAVCIAEGKAWGEAGQPKLALDAWREGLRRAGGKGPVLYRQMLDWTRDRPGLHATLARLSHANPDYFLSFLSQSSHTECNMLIAELMTAEPKLESFTQAQRQALFSIWFHRGDRPQLFSTLLANADWQRDGWRLFALLYAGAGDFKRACEIARDSTPRPAMPKYMATKPLRELERVFRVRPDNIDAGLQLYHAQHSEGKIAEALATLRALQASAKSLRYLAFIQAELLEESGDWEQAWKARVRFAGRDLQ